MKPSNQGKPVVDVDAVKDVCAKSVLSIQVTVKSLPKWRRYLAIIFAALVGASLGMKDTEVDIEIVDAGGEVPTPAKRREQVAKELEAAKKTITVDADIIAALTRSLKYSHDKVNELNEVIRGNNKYIDELHIKNGKMNVRLITARSDLKALKLKTKKRGRK